MTDFVCIAITRKLSATPIIYKDHTIVAKEVWVPREFLGKLNSPNPAHNHLQAIEMAEIVCDILERYGVYATASIRSDSNSEYSMHLDSYTFFSQEGDISFKALYTKKRILILGISDGENKVGKI